MHPAHRAARRAALDFARNPPRLATMSRMYDATSPDLTPFRARGGKLLMYHGWADPIVTPQ
jgi:feruloyl esterase